MNDKSQTKGSTRRSIVGIGLGLAGALVFPRPVTAQEAKSGPDTTPGDTRNALLGPIGRRKLGQLEVSAVGLGVQNMSRKYETTVPYWLP